MDNPVYFEDQTGAITMAVFQNIVDNSEDSPNGGIWSSSNGGGGGSYDYCQSESDAFESGAFYNMNSGYGAWRTNPGGAYAGAYYNYVIGTGRADIPDYATFRTDFFRTLPEVTINEGDPGSLAAARSIVYQEVQEDLDGIGNENASMWENFALGAETGNAWAEDAELGAKYANRVMEANGLEEVSAGELNITIEGLEAARDFTEGSGLFLGVASITLNAIRYNHGDISGTEFWTNTSVTTAALIASALLGPEAGIAIEAGVAGAKYIANAEEKNPRLRNFANQMATGPWMQ